MLQQEICFVHIRISVASGHAIPDITFKSQFIEESDTKNQTHHNLLTLKGIKPPLIDLEKLDDIELREALLKFKGFRYDRDLIIETFKRLNTETVNKSASLQPSMSQPKDDFAMSSITSNDESKTVKQETKNDANDHPRTYAACVAGSSTDQQISKEEKHFPEIANDSNIVSSDSKFDDSIKTNVSDGFSTLKLDDSQSKQHSSSRFPISSVSFFSGNPAVDITNGIIHLYKTNFKVAVGDNVPPPSTNTLCMLSVPASIDTHNLLEFTAPYIEVIQQMRIIRDRTPNQYMILLTFLKEQDASEFYLNLNNQPFSSLFPEEICRLAFVASVEALAPPGGKNVEDHRFLPIPNCTELPDCMVCLERMDESVQGLLTVLCNHSFHAACLQKWEDLCCPVCRYVQTPEPRCDNKCMVCGAAEDLWICLVCGNVGCGRYTSEHAQRHYLETHHNFAMSLSDKRVWDYAGDYFVHRLFQNKDDGKLVEKNSTGDEQENKLEGLQLECMHLLTTQLESQRKYWEEQVAKIEERARDDQDQVIKDMQQIEENASEMQIKVNHLVKENQSLLHRNEKLNGKLRDTLKDLAGEREMNKGLTQNQDSWKQKVKLLEERCSNQETQLKDLQEQLRDVMFYIQASQKISSETEEVQEELREGQVVVGPSSSSSDPGKSRMKGRRKR